VATRQPTSLCGLRPKGAASEPSPTGSLSRRPNSSVGRSSSSVFSFFSLLLSSVIGTVSVAPGARRNRGLLASFSISSLRVYRMAIIRLWCAIIPCKPANT